MGWFWVLGMLECAPMDWNLVRDYFNTDIGRLLLDKGLNILVGGVIAYLFARSLERFRRVQSVSGELGRIRAKAVVDVFGKLAAADMALARVVGAHARHDAEGARNWRARFEKVWESYAEETDKNAFLLGQEMIDISHQYEKWIWFLLEKVVRGEMLTEAEEKEGREFRAVIWRMLPSLQLSDEHSDYGRGWWKRGYWRRRMLRPK